MIERLKSWWKNLWTRKCRCCNKPLTFANEWERQYRLYCSECGWKPHVETTR